MKLHHGTYGEKDAKCHAIILDETDSEDPRACDKSLLGLIEELNDGGEWWGDTGDAVVIVTGTHRNATATAMATACICTECVDGVPALLLGNSLIGGTATCIAAGNTKAEPGDTFAYRIHGPVKPDGEDKTEAANLAP